MLVRSLILEQLKLVLLLLVRPLVGPLVMLLAMLLQVQYLHLFIRLIRRDNSLYRIRLIVSGALVII